ncbi:MAG: protoheme IX farnesyltransferase [Caulobacteraceae bacterium]|nr:protoheme IX farnesyltransferase [Caulobacteraceae bacterium]
MTPRGAPSAAMAAGAARFGARSRDWLLLLKPRLMSLVVFTGLTGLLAASRPLEPARALLAMICIAVGAGGSGALNMWWDADIDAKMRRTRARPIPVGRVKRAEALALGLACSLVSVLAMGLVVNRLAAGLLAFTIFSYAVVYTMWLKRSTPQNIVIGGLAGALPPVIGWAAASGTAPPNAWLLCAIIFFWTPPHFWSLSLYASEDFARAGLPMMPLVKGAAATRRQILIYSFILAPLAVAPSFTGLAGGLYLFVSAIGGLAFLRLALRLAASRAGEIDADGARLDAQTARQLFGFSILYLSLLFASLLLEKLTGILPLAV